MNPLGLPVDVSPIVRGTQFLGVMIGVLMEDEIPQGLELLAISVNGNFLHHTSGRIHKRVIASSLLRLVVGYMYLTSLFVNVVQTDNVLEIFFDVLGKKVACSCAASFPLLTHYLHLSLISVTVCRKYR